MNESLLLLGLGNWEIKNAVNRHNFGYMAVDYIRKSFPSVEEESLNSDVLTSLFDIEKSKTKNNGKSTSFYTVKVKDYMNLSGKNLNILFQKIGCSIDNLVVISDDLDIELGYLRIDKNIGGGNHKGILSIINSLSTKNFARIRIGSGPKPQEKENNNLSFFVVEKLNKKEKDIIDSVFFDLPAIVEDLIMKDFSFVQSKYNGKKPLWLNFYL